MKTKSRRFDWPLYGWIGLGLLLCSWILNWSLTGLRTHILFFPLWLGYCLFIDACVFKRKKTSLITRSLKYYIFLFFISAPAWWLFELINLRTENWLYTGREHFNNLEYFLHASLNFSTVLPAVFGTAEFVSTFKWIKQLKKGPIISTNRASTVILFILGWLMLVCLLIWPRYFYPCVWLSVYFLIDPLNTWLKNRSLIQYTHLCDWRPVLSLWCGCLICGFFWEMWNFYSFPKWIYQVPFVDFFHIFEMPVLGYLGYLPFSLELFALYHLVILIVKEAGDREYIQIVPAN